MVSLEIWDSQRPTVWQTNIEFLYYFKFFSLLTLDSLSIAFFKEINNIQVFLLE